MAYLVLSIKTGGSRTMPDATVSVLTSVTEVSATDWDGLACPEAAVGRPIDPFTTHRFLAALDRSGSTGKGTGWQPRPLITG
jgi:uncharacterized protein